MSVPWRCTKPGTQKTASQGQKLHPVGEVLQVPGFGQKLQILNALPDGDPKLVG
jgi:hypothetical protein